MTDYRGAFRSPPLGVPLVRPRGGRATPPAFAGLDEEMLVAHFAELGRRNATAEKFTPAVVDAAAARFATQPMTPEPPPETEAGNRELEQRLEAAIAELTGMDTVTVRPPTAEHALLTAFLVVRAFHEAHGGARKIVLVPKAAPLTAAGVVRRAGYQPVAVDGLRLDAVTAAVDRHGRDIAALFLGHPGDGNRLEPDLAAIAELVHAIGARLVLDGNRWETLHGYAKPRDLGIDVVLRDGAVAATGPLARYVPGPRPDAIGTVGGTAARLDRLAGALAYFLEKGSSGLKAAAEHSALAACYLRRQGVGRAGGKTSGKRGRGKRGERATRPSPPSSTTRARTQPEKR